MSTVAGLKKPLRSVLIKPAGPDCNFACDYCFYLPKAPLFPAGKTHRMSEPVLEETIRQVMTQGPDEVVFVWQGGEPTLMGLPFYEKAVELQQRYGKNQVVGNALQTNGLLLDGAWARFLSRYSFLVGLSLDGPEPIHDHYRKTRGGSGTWAQTIASAKMLIAAGVAVNALAVVNDHSQNFPAEIYRFFKDQGLRYMQFIPCVEPDSQHLAKPAGFSASPRGYGEFLCRVFDLWLADFDRGAPTTSVRFFDSLLQRYAGAKPPECTLLHACGEYLVIEHTGELFSCDFYVEPAWRLGNVMQDQLADVLNSPRQAAFGSQKAALAETCLSCEWRHVCRGGCTKHRWPDETAESINYFCDAYKMFFAHADARLRDLTRGERKQLGRNDDCGCGSGLKMKKCCAPLYL
jgi:uncharacterized protein